MGKILKAHFIVAGQCAGKLIKTSQSISFWGGVDPKTGVICDPRHELFGQSISGKILAFPYGKGSSTGSLIVLELARTDKAPLAIINITTEPILATGPIVCKHFYKKIIPVMTVSANDFEVLQNGQNLSIDTSTTTVTITE